MPASSPQLKARMSRCGAGCEGEIIFGERDNVTGRGIDFSERNVTRLLEREPMAAPAAACLALAWRNRMAMRDRRSL